MRTTCKDCANIRENIKPYMRDELKGNKTQYCRMMDDQMDMETGFCQDFQLHNELPLVTTIQVWDYDRERWVTVAKAINHTYGRAAMEAFKTMYDQIPYRIVESYGEIYQ